MRGISENDKKLLESLKAIDKKLFYRISKIPIDTSRKYNFIKVNNSINDVNNNTSISQNSRTNTKYISSDLKLP